MTKRGTDVELACRCGQVGGMLRGAARDTVNRSVCYCRDCQAYLHRLGRADLLDEYGGTDLVQVAPAVVSFDRGADQIRALRLTPKGMYRWYASCCNTPLGNTLEPKVPFIGIPAGVFRNAPDRGARDVIFGKVRAPFQTASATSKVPNAGAGAMMNMALHLLRLLASWKLRGRAHPHPFFDARTGKARFPVDVLTPAERDALRPLTGPGTSSRAVA